MSVCQSVQPIRKQHSQISAGQQSFASKLGGLSLSRPADENLGSVLLETPFVGQKPIKSELSQKWFLIGNFMWGV